jgi:hypothetical protein
MVARSNRVARSALGRGISKEVPRFWCPGSKCGSSHALAQLQADALITLDEEFAAAVKGLVTVAPLETVYDIASCLEA